MQKRNNRIELQGCMGTATSFGSLTSASRMSMYAHHLDQTVSPLQSDINHIMTGAEPQLRAFDIRMPTNGEVFSVHHKYSRGLSDSNIKSNPLTTVIYRCQETGVYDMIDITNYHHKHRVYGSQFVMNPEIKNIRPGSCLPKDMVLAKNPNTKEGGIFSNGLSCSIVNLSVPATIEDGYAVSESFCERASLLELPTLVAEWGKRMYPLNLYGDETHFKAFPDIGDIIREDGLIFAMREYSSVFGALEMTNKALMEVDMVHDIRKYGLPGATVIDITVDSGIGETKAKPMTPAGMTEQSEKYISQMRFYYRSILDAYDQILARGGRLQISPQLTQLINRAFADEPNSPRSKATSGGIIKRTYKSIPLDEYRVEIKCAFRRKLGLGAKLSGTHGNKGVICAIWPDADMPVDSAGNRADIIMFSRSAVARMNLGQLFEQYINAASRDMAKWIRESYLVGLPFEQIWDRLVAYYQAAAPLNYHIVTNHYNRREDQIKHIESIINSTIYLYIPPDATHLNKTILPNIEKVISPTYGPVTYRALNGAFVTTKKPALIGIQQMIVLEKTDHHPMSASSGNLQHHGLLASTNKISKNAHPSKVQVTTVMSETEVRLVCANMGGYYVSKLLILANSPEAHKLIVQEIMMSPTPTYLDTVNVNHCLPRPLMFIKDIMVGFGLEMQSADIPDKYLPYQHHSGAMASSVH